MIKSKQWIAWSLAAALLLPAASASAMGPISVELNGAPLQLEEQPFLYQSRTLVPLRGIFEALGADVTWDDATNTVTATKGDVTIQLTNDQWYAERNGAFVPLDAAPLIREGRMFVPVRFIAEAFHTPVQWDAATSTVRLLPSNRERLNELLAVPEVQVSSFHLAMETTIGKIDPTVSTIDYAALNDGSLDMHEVSEYTLPYTNQRETIEAYDTGRYSYVLKSSAKQWKKISLSNRGPGAYWFDFPTLSFPTSSAQYAVLEEQTSEDIITFYVSPETYQEYNPTKNMATFLEPNESGSVEVRFHLQKQTHQVTGIDQILYGRAEYEAAPRAVVTTHQRYSNINQPYRVNLPAEAKKAVEVTSTNELYS